MTSYANLTGLRSLAPAQDAVTAHTTADGADDVTQVTVTNTSATRAPAFFIRADVRRGSASGLPAGGDDEVLPALWSDNDTTLWPGEPRRSRSAMRPPRCRALPPWSRCRVSGVYVPQADVFRM